jgi:hypothetical protein
MCDVQLPASNLMSLDLEGLQVRSVLNLRLTM